jgi:biopolymer transport protein TolR
MSMLAGSGRSLSSEINVTPLIDVLLVLLIIFMVIVPVTPKGLDAVAPQTPKQNVDPVVDSIVVQVRSTASGSMEYRINQQQGAKKDLMSRLTAIFATRAEKVMFIQGDNDLDFDKVAEVVDIGHRAGVDSIGLITPKVEVGL